jgi:dihydrolipoamide dehydrogenase
MKKYDIAVVGGGAGLFVVEAAINMGYRCAMVEEAKLGGTCLTRGCIPSKILVAPADLIRETQRAEKIGLKFTAPKIDWEIISRRMWNQINVSKKVDEKLARLENIDVYYGTGSFVDEHHMKIVNQKGEEEVIESVQFVLAAGARTFIPPIQGLEQAGYITSESFFGEKFPVKPWKSLVLLGGGAIGAEFAHIFSSFGTKVTLVEMRNRILATEEEEISQLVEKIFRQNGIQVITGHKAISAEAGNQEKKLLIKNQESGEEGWVSGEEIFVASGLASNADKLKLDRAGVYTDNRGYIITDEGMKTNKAHIWALGDVNGKYQFRHKANHEANVVTQNLLKGDNRKANYKAVPWAIFTHPQVAHVGMTEREVEEKHQEYFVGHHKYSQVAGGIAIGYDRGDEDQGFIKILVSKDKHILGVHIVGPHAAILLQPFVYLMNSGESCERNQPWKNQEVLSEWEELHIMCPEPGSYMPIHDSMIIHPSLNELTAWVLNRLEERKQ